MKIKNYYSHLVTLLLCFWIMQPIFSQNIVITEIMYNPPESGTDSLEYIELYNSGNTTINLEGYSMTGVTLTFPSFEIPANAFAIVCVNDTAFTNVFGATAHLIQSTGGGLSNTGELIEVKDPNGTTVASVTYADAGEWPIEPDGAGASLELCSVSADMALPINWKAATLSTGATVNGIEIFASPGSANSVICGELPDHTITVSSFQFSPADITIYVGETVEWNNISGTHNVNGTQSTFPSNPESFGNAVGGSPWSYQYTFTIPGVNHFQCDPHSGQMQGTVTVIEVPPPVIRNIVITEIMYNDPSANDTLEFIEIYNNDTLAVNLGGYQFTQGVNYTFPAITLNVGDFLVVAKDSQIFQNSFGFPAFDWVNSQALANAGETIELRDNNNNVVDAVTYDNTGSWDPAANGNGASLVLCDFNSDNNVGANWRGSTTTTSIVLENIVISANPYEASDCPTGLSLVNDEYTTDVNVSFPLNVLLNDQLTANYEIQIPGTTALGTIGVVNGAITYIPNADVCGDDVFIYMVTDVASGVMDTATVTVHIINCPLNYPVRTITSVTSENSDGVADSLNVICELTGTVYGINFRESATGVSFTIIDNSHSGIGVFNGTNTFGYSVDEGEIVTVRGKIGQFNGLTQIVADTIFQVGTGSLLEPTTVTALSEATESNLVRLLGYEMVDPLQWTNGQGSGFNVDFRRIGGTEIVSVRIDNDCELFNVSSFIVAGSCIITGIGGQFDNSSPYTSGYQLFPRYSQDIGCITDSVNDFNQIEFSVQPNPASDLITIQANDSFDDAVVYNYLGQIINTHIYNNKVDIKDLPKGNYWVRIQKNDKFGMRSFIKQ